MANNAETNVKMATQQLATDTAPADKTHIP